MANKQMSYDLSVFTLGGSSQLAVIENVSYDVEFDKEDQSVIKQDARVTMVTKRGGTLQATELSRISDGISVCTLDLSAFSIDAVDYLAHLKSLRFNYEIETRNTDGVADKWRWPQYAGKRQFTAEAELFIPISAGVMFGVEAHHATLSQMDMVLDLTLNSAQIALPMVGHKFSHMLNNGEEALYKVSLEGKRPDNLATAYPTAPTGTTTLLEKFFNAPNTPLAGVLTPHATDGGAYAGNLQLKSCGFSFDDGKLVKTEYTFLTQGAWTFTAN